MTISQYVRRILARWRLMALVTLAVLAAALLVTVTTPVTYTSTSQLYVASLSDQPDMESVQAAGLHAQGRMLSYAAVASSQEMAALVTADLGDDALDDAEVRTEVPYATVLINLTVTAPTADRAHDIAQSVADNYNDLLTDVEGARATELKVGVSTVNQPTLPTSPSSPKVALNLLAGLLAGLLLAVAVAAVRDLLDDRVRTDEDDLGAPVLGRLPAISTAADRTFELGATTPLAEEVRRLRVRLEGSPHRTWLVTAIDDGNAFAIATLLAQSFEQAGRDTVLVDADLRAPNAIERLGGIPAPGLTSVLAGDSTLSEALATTTGGLRELGTGPSVAAPHETVGSDGMSRLLGQLRNDHSMVLVAAPPVLAVADAAAMAHGVDGVLLVVRAAHTRQRDLTLALADLDTKTEVFLVVTDA